MKVPGDLDMLLISIKIGTVQKFVGQRDFLDTLLLIILKFFIQVVFNSEENHHSSKHQGIACWFFC